MDGEKREIILDAALRLINRFGFDKTTVAEIAEEAGIAKGTVYLYFNSKDEIYYALLSRESTKLKDQLLPNLEAAKDPVEKLHLFLTRVGLTPLENDFARLTLTQDYVQRLQGNPYSQVKGAQDQEQIKHLAGIINEGIEQGYFRPVDPEQAAVVMHSNLTSLALTSVLRKEYSLDKVRELVQVNADLMVKGIKNI